MRPTLIAALRAGAFLSLVKDYVRCYSRKRERSPLVKE
jgi:hypothetical protein